MKDIRGIIRQRVREFVAPIEGPLIVAVSGGADSTALLLATLSVRADVSAVHCNFGLRGEESNRDETFVRDLCERHATQLRTIRFQVRPETGQSVEMECRRLRYEWFDELRASTGATVLLAHTADDNIETLMLNLLRGSGVRGLAGIPAHRRGFGRPLLSTSRAEVEEYLRAEGESFVIDSTNLLSDYRRNFVRNEVLPLLATRWPGMKKALGLTLANMQADAAFIDYATAGVSETGCTRLSLSALPPQPASRTVIHAFAAKAGASAADAAEMARSVAEGASSVGARWFLANGIVELERDALAIYPVEVPGPLAGWTWMQVSADAEMLEKIVRRMPKSLVALPQGDVHRDFDVRYARTADRMRPLGMSGSRLLSDMARDAHLSLTQRERLRVVERKSDGVLIWAEGLRRAAHALVGPDATECIIGGNTHDVEEFLAWHTELCVCEVNASAPKATKNSAFGADNYMKPIK